MKKFEVQTYAVCDGWVNCWTDGEGVRQTYATKEEAENEIDEFIVDQNIAVFNGHITDAASSDEYRVREVEAKKTYKHESFGELLEFAESLGWVDTEDEWNEEIAEGLEAEATAFIEKAGYEVIY